MAKPSWITLSKSSGTGGGSVSVSASSNRHTSTRSGSLTVKTTSGITKTVSISQAKAVLVPTITTTQDSINVPSTTNLTTQTFTCNIMNAEEVRAAYTVPTGLMANGVHRVKLSQGSVVDITWTNDTTIGNQSGDYVALIVRGTFDLEVQGRFGSSGLQLATLLVTMTVRSGSNTANKTFYINRAQQIG